MTRVRSKLRVRVGMNVMVRVRVRVRVNLIQQTATVFEGREPVQIEFAGCLRGVRNPPLVCVRDRDEG